MIHQLLTDPDGRERSVRQVQARTMLALALENNFAAFVIPDQAFRQWTIDDLDLAVQLLDRPDSEVVDTVTHDWEHWTAPATTSAQLQQALNLHQPRTAEHQQDVWRFGGSDNPPCA